MLNNFALMMNKQNNPNLYIAGIPTNEFEYFAAPQTAGRQRGYQWCWAACVQMVLNYHGLYVQQEKVVQRVFGVSYDVAANLQQILYALSGWAPDTRGRYSQILAIPYVLNNSQLITDLANKWPLIVGIPGNPIGHACVLTAVRYSLTNLNIPILHSAVIRDPWPGNISRQEFPWPPNHSPFGFSVRVFVNRL